MRKMWKRIICIYELQAPGEHDLEEINTYCHAGIPALHTSRRILEERIQYDRLSFAYHYDRPLEELLEKESM